MSTENKAQFDEISSAMAYEHAVKNHPNKDVIPLIDWQYVHTWWRKGAKWQFDALQTQLDEKTAEREKLKLQLKNRSSHLQTATVDGIHKAWEENAKLRAELEEAKDSLKIMRGADKDNVKIAEVCFKLESENARLREALEQATIIDDAKWQHQNRAQMSIALHGVSNGIVRALNREALKQEGEG